MTKKCSLQSVFESFIFLILQYLPLFCSLLNIRKHNPKPSIYLKSIRRQHEASHYYLTYHLSFFILLSNDLNNRSWRRVKTKRLPFNFPSKFTNTLLFKRIWKTTTNASMKCKFTYAQLSRVEFKKSSRNSRKSSLREMSPSPTIFMRFNKKKPFNV